MKQSKTKMIGIILIIGISIILIAYFGKANTVASLIKGSQVDGLDAKVATEIDHLFGVVCRGESKELDNETLAEFVKADLEKELPELFQIIAYGLRQMNPKTNVYLVEDTKKAGFKDNFRPIGSRYIIIENKELGVTYRTMFYAYTSSEESYVKIHVDSNKEIFMK